MAMAFEMCDPADLMRSWGTRFPDAPVPFSVACHDAFLGDPEECAEFYGLSDDDVVGLWDDE